MYIFILALIKASWFQDFIIIIIINKGEEF